MINDNIQRLRYVSNEMQQLLEIGKMNIASNKDDYLNHSNGR